MEHLRDSFETWRDFLTMDLSLSAVAVGYLQYRILKSQRGLSIFLYIQGIIFANVFFSCITNRIFQNNTLSIETFIQQSQRTLPAFASANQRERSHAITDASVSELSNYNLHTKSPFFQTFFLEYHLASSVKS